MGETTYVMRPVAYTSIYSVREHPKESVMHAALSQSISFGRFMSESLSWEKWSTFTSKKYVEEAERFAQPGSVAQKKAFFEAHYKRMSGKKETPASVEVANVAVTSSPPRGKLDTIKEQDREELNTKETKSSVLLDELKAVANKRAKVAAETALRLHEESEMKIESPKRFTHTCDDNKTGEMELNLNEPKLDIKENKQSPETSVLEETDTEVVESQCQLDKQDSRKMELNEEPESESPCSEYHSVKQDSVCSEEALLGTKEEEEEDSYTSTPINEKIIVMDSPHKKKPTARWLKPMRVTPSKEFNFFSLTIKKKPNKSRNSAEVAANGALKFRELTPETETRASENCTAIAESKNNPNGCSPSTAVFTKFWKKCTKKVLFSSFRLRNEEKARRKKEKVEKKPRKWGLTHCFKPSPYRKNHREKAKMEDQMKMIARSRP